MADPTEASLLQANEAFYRAFESLDLDRMRALWAQSVRVSCVHPGWDLIVGTADVMDAWREIFGRSAALRIQVDAPRATLRGEAGWVVCREVLHTSVQGQPLENTLTAINAFVWEEASWRISHHHASPRMAGRPSPKPPRAQTLH